MDTEDNKKFDYADVISLSNFITLPRNPVRVYLSNMISQFYGCPLNPTVPIGEQHFQDPYMSGFIRYAYSHLFEPNEFFDHVLFSNWGTMGRGYKEKALQISIPKILPTLFETPRQRLVAIFNRMFYVQHKDTTFEDLCDDYPRNMVFRLGYCMRNYGTIEFGNSFLLSYSSTMWEDRIVIHNEHGSLFFMERTLDWNYYTFIEKFLSIELLQNLDFSTSHLV